MERIATAKYRWLRRALTVGRADDLAGIEREIAAMGVEAPRCLVKLDLTGSMRLDEVGSLEARLTALENALAVLDVERGGLRISSDAEDLAALGDGTLLAIAEGLRASAQAGEAGADRALYLLARLAAEAKGA